jgi:electron transfer flavoprotein beta subunit
MGSGFALDVMKKPLSMGADELVLLQDNAFDNTADSFFTAQVLAAAVTKLGGFDLIICGRQASDWDNAQVPLGVAELLGLSCVALGKKVEVQGAKVVVERLIPDGYEVVEASLPALVTVSNELGQPRYPTLRGIMAATRKRPTIWSAADLGLQPAQLLPRLTLHDLFVPSRSKVCEFIEGDDEADRGRKLALKLREAKLI